MSDTEESTLKTILQVFAPGSHVVLLGEIKARVVSVTVMEKGHVQYDLTWVSGADVNEATVTAGMVGFSDVSGKISVGFREANDGEG